MRSRIGVVFRNLLLVVVLFAAVLSVSNPEIPWFPVNMTISKGTAFTQRPAPRFESSVVAEDEAPLALFKSQLQTDDLADQNPFANLSSEDPIRALFEKGIARFERRALRSGSYRDEVGYDILHYEIEQKDGLKAHVLAYLERSLEEIGNHNQGGEPSLQSETLVVMVIQPSANESLEMAVYRDGALIEISTISMEQSRSLLAQRLNDGIPFLSVAR